MDGLINNTNITGRITSGFTFSHEVFGKRFYQMMVSVSRLSRQNDILPVLVSENKTMLDMHEDYTGHTVAIAGRFQSYNRIDETGRHLDLSVHADEIRICNEPMVANRNQIVFTDVLIAVCRCSQTSDYIPCILWGDNARWASCYEVGTRIEVEGRVQSREYIKKLSDSECETRVAYEVSVNRIRNYWNESAK